MADPGVTVTTIDPAPGERFQRLRAELGVSAFGINVIALEPRQRMRVHVHEHQEEVYAVLEGELTLVTGEGEHTLTPGGLARVAPATRRQLVNRGAGRVHVLVVGASVEHGHESRDALAWGDWDEDGPGHPPQDVPLPGDLPA